MDNFLSNAVRFCIPGGVIRLSVARNYVSVYNEGIQIPEERKKEIWTPMYLIDDSRTKQEQLPAWTGNQCNHSKAHHAAYGVET